MDADQIRLNYGALMAQLKIRGTCFVFEAGGQLHLNELIESYLRRSGLSDACIDAL